MIPDKIVLDDVLYIPSNEDLQMLIALLPGNRTIQIQMPSERPEWATGWAHGKTEYNVVNRKNIQAVLNAQKEWLYWLNSISIKPPKLAWTQRDGKTPGTRFLADKYIEPWPWQYRVVLPNELVYDFDVTDWELLQIIASPVIAVLYRLGIPHVFAGSGGNKSIHIHVFFKPNVLCVRYGWKEVRFALWNWILDKAGIPDGIPEDMRGDGRWAIEANKTGDWKKELKIKPTGEYYETSYPADSSCINFADMSQGGKVVRDFGGSKDRVKRKTVIPAYLPLTREAIYKSDKIIIPRLLPLWDVTGLLETKLEFPAEWQIPKSCSYCPVDPDWMLQFEAIQDGDFEPVIFQHPKICRECRGYRRE